MLKILKYSKTQDFFNNISDLADLDNLIIVTPNPNMADLTRKRLNSRGQDIDAITISKFIKDEISILLGVEKLERYYSKSELILWLGGIWKKIGKDDFVSFDKCFRVLTELRSFSMSDQVYETVMENYDSEMSESVLWLQRFLDQLEIVDEHKANFLISEVLRAGNLPLEYKVERTIVFYGFDFLTASQVDLLKSLALRDDVLIPLYKNVYDEAVASDWINWFDQHNLEVLDISENYTLKEELNTYQFPKGYLSKVLTELESKDEIILATKNLTRECIQEIPFENKKFKTPVDLYSSEYNKMISLLEPLIDQKLEISSLKSWVIQAINEFVSKSEYRLIKCFTLFYKKLVHWEEIVEEGSLFDEYTLRLLDVSTRLDLPRINLTHLIDTGVELRDIKQIEEIKNKSVYLIIQTSYGSMSGISANFTENIEKYLSSIGPIRRAGFEETNLLMQLEEFYHDNEIILLIEKGYLEHSLFWSKNLVDKKLINLEVPIKSIISQKPDCDERIQSPRVISASRLQNFIDCPRKYYLNYIEKLSPSNEFNDELNALDLGWAEHKIIEIYFSENSDFDEKRHIDVVQRILLKVLKGKTISSVNLQKYHVEATAFTADAIRKIIEIKNKFNMQVRFEAEFDYIESETTFRGSMDCICYNDNAILLLDFKRSNFSFTSFTSILNFEVIQLWFYASRIKKLGLNQEAADITIGYIDLSDMTNSMLFTSSKDLLTVYKKDLGFSKVKLVPNIDEIRTEYNEFEQATMKRLFEESEFTPKPKNEAICNFCSISNICQKGEL